MAVAAASAWASRSAWQVGCQRGQRLGAGVVVGDGGGGGQRLGQDGGLLVAGRCGASAVSAWAREESSVMAVAAASAWASTAGRWSAGRCGASAASASARA